MTEIARLRGSRSSRGASPVHSTGHSQSRIPRSIRAIAHGTVWAAFLAQNWVTVVRAQVPPAKPEGSIRLVTLNAAHGRGSNGGMTGLSLEIVESNLDAIADQLKRARADIIGLQEVDGPSDWTGLLDHAARLADRLDIPHRFHGIHFRATLGPFRMQYGTAVLSVNPIENPWSLPLPTESWHTKGAVGADVLVAGRPATVVSVHLDSGEGTGRRQQVDRLIEELRNHPRPLILVGDLNSGWANENDAVRRLADRLGLLTWEPSSAGLHTFPARRPDRRIDWIMVDPRLEIIGYGLLPAVASDHLPVWADVTWRAMEPVDRDAGPLAKP